MAVGDDRSFNFEGLRISDVVKILKDIDIKKATGWDTIPPKAFKMARLSSLYLYGSMFISRVNKLKKLKCKWDRHQGLR